MGEGAGPDTRGVVVSAHVQVERTVSELKKSLWSQDARELRGIPGPWPPEESSPRVGEEA